MLLSSQDVLRYFLSSPPHAIPADIFAKTMKPPLEITRGELDFQDGRDAAYIGAITRRRIAWSLADTL